ncbi:MAG TPA: aminotransferase class I/II-fold pyridoxal phosphate-dependent enzyme, partial [Myxococcota bacterium]|nr:aminotransferase class I/II-fold pyridoxal phosphate-dependent enzyme [Myxococcota bacterium]
MKTAHEQGFATICIHAGQEPEGLTGAVMTPIFQSSTYAQASPAKHKGYEYSRSHNPTRTALEKNLAALENARFAFAFSSGCAATTILLLGLNPSDHVVAMDDLYGGTRRLFTKVFERFGINITFVDLSDPTRLIPALTPKTKMVWVESPSNPLLKLIDIKALGEETKKRGLSLVVDNTFATPALQNPLTLNADIVLHSTTKYLGGHSDVVGGAIMTNDASWAEKIAFLSNAVGAIPAPWDCFLVLRGTKTLDVRMKQHCHNAAFIAQALSDHPKVTKVFFPGLISSEFHELSKKQMRGPSGMVSFILKGGEQEAKRICEQTRLFTCAESLGGVESLIEHPTSMTHASV